MTKRHETEEDLIDRQLREFEKTHPATPKFKAPSSRSMDSFVFGIERELHRAEESDKRKHRR
jgi:hypothetical protein